VIAVAGRPGARDLAGAIWAAIVELDATSMTTVE
jgi:hypothetical protein